MSQTVVVATAPVAANIDPAEPLGLDADFEARWAAWQARGIAHDRTTRRRLLMVAPAVAIAIAYLLLIG